MVVSEASHDALSAERESAGAKRRQSPGVSLDRGHRDHNKGNGWLTKGGAKNPGGVWSRPTEIAGAGGASKPYSGSRPHRGFRAERPSEARPGPGPHHSATDVQEGAGVLTASRMTAASFGWRAGCGVGWLAHPRPDHGSRCSKKVRASVKMVHPYKRPEKTSGLCLSSAPVRNTGAQGVSPSGYPSLRSKSASSSGAVTMALCPAASR